MHFGLVQVVLYAFVATMGTWFVTALGASSVFLFKKLNEKILNLCVGFSAGVMIAASFWSLLQPAIERADEMGGLPSYIVVTAGFLFGALFIYFCDRAVSAAQKNVNRQDGAPRSDKLNRVILLILSITLHNIPEGLAVGVAFGALYHGEHSAAALASAISVAIGIGLQNFPEGAAVSIPLRLEGYSRAKSFFYGQASGLVEPVAGVFGALLVLYVTPILPLSLAFAAGCMILVAVHELIPQCQSNKELFPYFSSMGIIVGFAVMMFLDVSLG